MRNVLSSLEKAAAIALSAAAASGRSPAPKHRGSQRRCFPDSAAPSDGCLPGSPAPDDGCFPDGPHPRQPVIPR
jgi:hypothetical protein